MKRLQRKRWENSAKKAADNRKGSQGKGQGRASLNQEGIRGAQHLKMKAETQEHVQFLGRMIDAMGDDDHTSEQKETLG